MNNTEKRINLLKDRIAKINENVAKEDGVFLELEVQEDDLYPYIIHMKTKVTYQDAVGKYIERIRSNSFKDLKDLSHFLRGLEWYFGLL
jgi:hypothetical protein